MSHLSFTCHIKSVLSIEYITFQFEKDSGRFSFLLLIMKQQLKEQFPQWCADFTQGQNNLTLTDDFDSLFGCAIEQEVKGNNINYFYCFDNLYVADRKDNRRTIGIDLALHKGKSWCNHVVKITPNDYTNPQTANLNVINNIHSSNYTKKYAMSTALLMMSYYNLPLPKTKEGKMLLIAIDSGFLGHYKPYFKNTHNSYLEMLGYTELIDVLSSSSEKDFISLQKQYNTKAKIQLNSEGILQSQLPLAEMQGLFDFKLELPEQPFTLRNKLQSYNGYTSSFKSKEDIPNLISFALTRKNEFKYTSA